MQSRFEVLSEYSGADEYFENSDFSAGRDDRTGRVSGLVTARAHSFSVITGITLGYVSARVTFHAERPAGMEHTVEDAVEFGFELLHSSIVIIDPFGESDPIEITAPFRGPARCRVSATGRDIAYDSASEDITETYEIEMWPVGDKTDRPVVLRSTSDADRRARLD